jgi:glycosyltransferase involved in cell wall biosynthesis
VALRLGLGLARQRLGRAAPPELHYVVPGGGWVLEPIGRQLTAALRERFGWGARLISSPRALVGQIVHYGSLWTFLAHRGSRANTRNTAVATVFHGDRRPEFPELARAVDELLAHARELARVATASRIMEDRLLGWGLPRAAVVRLPLGVDLRVFRPGSAEARRASRARLGIPEQALCVGSFQKDGSGFGEGLEPKWIKGPDLLVEVLARLRRELPVVALLTAPARGYVKRGLDRRGVPWRHVVPERAEELAALYPALDAYLVTSREEGGPQGVLEALACGVPVVSTRVGLAPDVIEHGGNGLLAEVEDAGALAEAAAGLLADAGLRERLARRGPGSVADHGWDRVAERYYRELYQPLLRERGA